MATRKKPRRKPGGQAGNKNALRHGFYAKRFTTEQKKRLDGQEPTDVQAEINLLRVCLDLLYDQIDISPVYAPNKAGGQSEIRDDHYLKQMNTLSLITQSLGTLIRTHYLTRGKGGQLEKSITEALEELRLEMGL